mmetsp:Transcript_10459/g.30755  ORF Transcript_10459/g.30755 Transcript_10459/m.30755 type:complete len:330 (-) Transcript_10459:180-1169(-)
MRETPRTSFRRFALLQFLLVSFSLSLGRLISAFTTPPTALSKSASRPAARKCGGAISLLFSAEQSRGVETAAAEEKGATTTPEAGAVSVDEDHDGLTAQERVLRSLGVEPESDEERRRRVSDRLAAEEEARAKKRTNAAVAVLAFAAAVLNYGWKVTHPVTAVEILAEMQSQSAPLTVIGRNGRPTVVDFWAPWCENCRFSAPTLQSVEKEYAGKVNFVMVNGDDPDAWPLIERFGVDAIPHLSMISKEGDVETALIGPIPRSVLRADIDELLEREEQAQPKLVVDGGTGNEEDTGVPVVGDDNEKDKPLPYVMYDAFRGRPELRRVQF